MTDHISPNPFNRDSLRLAPSHSETIGVEKLLMNVLVRKPTDQDFSELLPVPDAILNGLAKEVDALVAACLAAGGMLQ
jgi:hypothetical protein